MPMSSKLQQASAYVTWHFNTYKSLAAHLKLKLSSGETFSLCLFPQAPFSGNGERKTIPKVIHLALR